MDSSTETSENIVLNLKIFIFDIVSDLVFRISCFLLLFLSRFQKHFLPAIRDTQHVIRCTLQRLYDRLGRSLAKNRDFSGIFLLIFLIYLIYNN